MARKISLRKRGQVVTLSHQSNILKDNPLGDPTDRQVQVYLPAAYDNARQNLRRFSVLYDLVGYTGAGPSHTNWRNFEENVPEKLDRLIGTGRMPPCIVVFPDCFTALGGNQYINSSAIGDYADYLTREIIPFVDNQLRTRGDREHRACFGKSSGGYGAMVHGMRYTRYWGAIGNHSGDAYFDFVYRSEWPGALTHLQRFTPKRPAANVEPGMDDGRIAAFLKDVYRRSDLSGNDIMCLMMVCMAATYDPDADAPLGFRLPFDLETGELLAARWKRWLKHDPVYMVRRYQNNLRSLKGILIDCGYHDQYHIHFGSRQLHQRLIEHRVQHSYEEFEGTHSGIDHRMDVSLPYLAKSVD